jgi:peptide/nickel transport system permease protein
MFSYILRRLGYMSVTLVLVAIIGFIIIELPPGSFLEFELERIRQLGGDLNQEMIRGLEMRYGVHDPVYLKFWKWISGFVTGDFGLSFEYWTPVSGLLWGRLWITIWTSLLTLVFQWVLAIVIGVYSATHRYSPLDYFITVLQFIGLSVPAFLLALVMMVLTHRFLGWHVGGLYSPEFRDLAWSWAKFVDLLKHLWLPIVVVGASGTAWLSRVMRANLLDVLNMQYVQTARAKGVKENTVIWKHAVRNAIHPLIMVLGASLPGIISGQLIVGIVLNLPTVGPVYFRALMQQDMYMAATVLVFLAIALLIGNLLADILLAVVDPRIRLG